MMAWDGEITPPERHSHLLQEPLHNEAFVSSVTIEQHDAAVFAVADNAFVTSELQDTSLECRDDFSTALEGCAEITKMMGSLGSINSCDLHDDLFDTPVISKHDNVEDNLYQVLQELGSSNFAAQVQAIRSTSAKGVSAEFLSKIWMIDESLAKKTLEKTTQLCKHHTDSSLSRNFSTNDRMLRYRRLGSIFYTDTLVALNTKSLQGNKYAQIFVSDRGYVAAYPMISQSEFPQALHWFCKEVGVPHTLVMDGHKAQTSILTRKFCHQVGTMMQVLEVGTPWANRAELYIGLLKEAVRKDLRRSNAPKILWDYCLERRAHIHNYIP